MSEDVLKIIPKSKKLSPISIGANNPVFTIAEIGLNHNGNIKLGKKLIDSAYHAGCSSVKFQNFETDDVYIQGEKAGKYQLLGKDIDIYDLHKNLEIELEFLSELKDYAESKGMYFFSAPMGIGGGVFNVPIFKLFGYSIKVAIGSSAAIGFLNSLTGATGFAISGNYFNANIPLSLGFVNIPTFLIFVPITVFMAKIGAKTVHKVDKNLLGKLFGIYLFIVGSWLFLEYLKF